MHVLQADIEPLMLALIPSLLFLFTDTLQSSIASPLLSPSDSDGQGVNASYIWTTFSNPSETDLYVYTSDDATNWTLFAGPTYTPDTGVMRDPSIMKHTDGKYYITYTTGWNGTNFAIASSSDLIKWNLHATISTASSVITPVNTWAPEIFKDPKTGNINIIVSLSTALYGPFKPYAFTATDSTLQSWTGPVVLSGIPGNGLGFIDSFPVFFNNSYHLFTKNETVGSKFVQHAVADALTGPYTFVQTGNFAGWGHAEGPCVTILPDGRFRLFADGFDSDSYLYSDSTDLFDWSSAKNVSGGLSGFVRHGTVLKQ